MSEEGDRVMPNKTKQAHGSNAGAGSGALVQYRKHRRLEMDRVEKLDRAQAREEKNDALQAELAERNAALDSRTEKNRKRRKRQSKLQTKEEEESTTTAQDNS